MATRQIVLCTTQEQLFHDHGGEMQFYLDWVLGEVSRRVQVWVRRHARADPAWHRDVASVDSPTAREDVQTALEVTHYLTPVEHAPPAAGESLTTLAMEVPEGAAHAARREAPLDHGRMNDEQLMQLFVKERDTEALAELYRRHGAWLRARARRRGAGRQLAEDAVQQVWVRLLDPRRGAGATYDPRHGSVQRFLGRLLHRILVDHLRACRRQRRTVRFTDLRCDPGARALAHCDEGPSDQTVAMEFFDCVYHFLRDPEPAWCPGRAPDPVPAPRRELLETAVGRLNRREQVALCAWYDAGGDGDQALVSFRRAEKKVTPLAYTDYLEALRRSREKLRDALDSLALPADGTLPGAPAEDCPHPTAARVQLRERLHRSLFLLLAEIEIELPPRDEALEAGQLLHYLAGDDALTRFHGLHAWLQQVRTRAAVPRPPALDRVLRWLARDLFGKDGEVYRYRLSFCLYLRARLKDYCRQRDWQPTGRRHRNLDAACAALDRERLGEIVRRTVQAVEEEDQGVAAGVSANRVLDLLAAEL
jgi:DNA-directed RNA polymerase specialized sigma24 family protein